MAFKRLSQHDTLTLPIGDKDYTFEPVDADLGLFLHELSNLMAMQKAAEESGEKVTIPQEQADRLKSMSEQMRGEDTLARMLGADQLEQLRADNVPWRTIQLVSGTILYWTTRGKDAAEEYWNHRGNVPKARKRPQDHKAGSGKGRTTKKRASTTGTRGKPKG